MTNRKRPRLRFSPAAWAKLLFLRDAGPTEIAAFGISSTNDPLLVENIELVAQNCTSTSVSLVDESVADFIDSKVDAGVKISNCLRIWLHTHPANSALPSLTDETTFQRVFGSCSWSVMAILARGGHSYARLQFGVGPGAALQIRMGVDYSCSFAGSDRAAWVQEYEKCVRPVAPQYADHLGRQLLRMATEELEHDELDEWEHHCERYF